MTRLLHLLRAMIGLGLLLGVSQICSAYSVLTHEEVVDLLWKDDITPLLNKRFPGSTAEDLKKAHAFAYGGSLIQDMGYYPFGSKYFSDLTHYVRSGDFIVNLLNEASDLNEYAFALGALAHYAADNIGHPTIPPPNAQGMCVLPTKKKGKKKTKKTPPPHTTQTPNTKKFFFST